MLRQLHSVPGLIFGLIISVLAISGAVLSLDPALERLSAPAEPAMTVADLADRASSGFEGIQWIVRHANGAVVVGYQTADALASAQIDPGTAEILAPWEPSALMRWVKGLHRTFLLDDAGRAVAGVSAGALAMLAVTGIMLLAAALGGWRRLARPVRGGTAARWHGATGRIALAALAVSALTGVWMSLASFGIVDDGKGDSPGFSLSVTGTAPAPVADLAALRAVPLGDLRRLTFPAAGDAQDVFGLQTVDGTGYVDQASGALLNWLPHSPEQRVWEFVYMLHSGQGLWWFGLILGAGALSVPVLSVTGTLVWLRRQRARPRIAGTVRAREADLTILVGSEAGTTWGFAATLARALIAAGRRVHVAPMNAGLDFPAARALILMTATHGDGSAPGSAGDFLARLGRFASRKVPVAVLGFGDRTFAQFCGYADTVAGALAARDWPVLLPEARIDRQSALDFAAWGRDLGAALGLPLTLDHRAAVPATVELELLSRQDFGATVQAPAAILRFGPVGRRLPRFEAGDLLGVIPPGSDLPRLYSLASSRRDGMVEIAVRKMPDGLCSGHLHELQPGGRIRAFIRPNPAFRPAPGRAPVIMVAAGCGIGPMVGFLHWMRPGRDTSLYFGARDPAADFLYEAELRRWQDERRLGHLVTAFSRVGPRTYVQDCLRVDAPRLRDRIAHGGQVLVCGSAAMARAVAAEIAAAIAPLGLTVAGLKTEGRYLEDVY